MSKSIKKRVWAFVVYPEGNPPAPDDWRDRLRKKGLRCAISPLHDKDYDPTGEPKKSHWHVIAIWNGPTTYSVVKAVTDELNAPIPKALEHVRGYYRYLTHQDNPEKHQYDPAGVDHLNGFDIADFVELTASEVSEIKRNIRQLIEEKDFTEYWDLCKYLDDEGLMTEAMVAENHTILFDALLRSRRHRNRPTLEVDPETGEVVER